MFDATIGKSYDSNPYVNQIETETTIIKNIASEMSLADFVRQTLRICGNIEVVDTNAPSNPISVTKAHINRRALLGEFSVYADSKEAANRLQRRF